MQDLIDRITRAYEADAASGRLARSKQDIPISYEAITPEWLTAIICEGVPGAAATAFRLGPKDNGTSNRRRIYVDYNEQGRQAGMPATVFCKASQHLSSRLTLGALGCTQAEYSFYRQVRPQLHFDAPEPIWANYDPHSLGAILVLRDLGEDMEFCDHHTKVDRARAESVMSTLAALHGRFYESKDLGTDKLPFALWTDWFPRLEQIGMHEYTDKGFRAAEPVIPPRLFARAGEIWGATLRSVDQHLRMPHTLLHSDTHLRNWYVVDENRLGLADWQSVCVGNWGRDLMYAMTCALTVEDRRAWEGDLLRLYLDRLHASGGPKLGFNEAWLICRQQLFSALAYWTVTLTPPPVMPDMQPVDLTLAFIERFAHAIDDLDSLDSFD